MPKLPKSEIFENYADLMVEKGIIKKAEPKDLEKYKKQEPYPRVGSDDISTIEALYGVKPEGQEYEYNIIEEAHPNAVIIAPSYDKMNGLVENNNERHNVMTYVALKPNKGYLDHYKYAKQELLLDLIKTANHMDAIDNDELRVLADSCIDELDQYKIQKKAWFWYAAAGVAAVIGAAAWINHARPLSQGVKNDAEKVNAEIDDLLSKDSVQQEPNARSMLSSIKKVLSELINSTRIFNKLSINFVNISEIQKLSPEENKKFQSDIEFIKKHNELVEKIESSIQVWIYQIDHIKRSVDERSPNWLQYLYKVYRTVVSDDFEDVDNALLTLKDSLKEMVSHIKTLIDYVDHAESQVEQVAKAPSAPSKGPKSTLSTETATIDSEEDEDLDLDPSVKDILEKFKK